MEEESLNNRISHLHQFAQTLSSLQQQGSSGEQLHQAKLVQP